MSDRIWVVDNSGGRIAVYVFPTSRMYVFMLPSKAACIRESGRHDQKRRNDSRLENGYVLCR